MEIHVKCQGVENEWVVITTANLPDDAYDVIYMLKAEYAGRHIWLEVASAYFDRGAWTSGITVLTEATSEGVEALLKSADEAPSARPPQCTRLDLLAALGGAYIMLADTQAADAPARAQSLEKARGVFDLVDQIDHDCLSVWIARGWSDFHAGKTSTAEEWFNNARGKQVVMSSVGLAALQLNRLCFLEPAEADERQREDPARIDPVELLIQALRARRCPPGVWTGLAHALFRENRLMLARDVAERAVLATRNLGPAERCEALYALARILMSDKKRLDAAQIAAALREAYVKCGGAEDARVLLLIAEFNLKRNFLELAEQFARAAVEKATDAPGASIGAMYAGVQRNTYLQALFQHGRALHHLNRADEAMDIFEQIKNIADTEEGKNMKINFGVYLRLGLLKLATGKKEDEAVAEECLEKVVKSNDHRVHVACRALGCLIGRREIMKVRRGKIRDGDGYARAIELLKKGISMDKEHGERDIPAQLVYAALLEEMSPEIALQCYERVVTESEKQQIAVDVAVRVNMASLLARLNRAKEAQEIFDELVDDKLLDPARPIINYNRGRIAEMLDNDDVAMAFYKTLKPEDVPYWEAHIRMALIANTRNQTQEAEDMFKTAMKDPHTRSMAAGYLSELYAKQKKFKDAQEILEKTRKESDFMELNFAKFMHHFLDSLGTQSRRKRFLIDHVGITCMNVMKKSKNAFAVNGLGVYFAESEMFEESKACFTSAGPNKQLSHAARINLAHVNIRDGKHMSRNAIDNIGRPDLNVLAIAKSKFQQAEKLYSDSLKLSSRLAEPKDRRWRIELLHYLGCAQFESRDYFDAVETFSQVLAHDISCTVVWYNLGVANFEAGMTRLKENKGLAGVERGMGELDASLNCFRRALSLPRQHVDPVAGVRLDPKLVDYWKSFVKQELYKHRTTLLNAKNEHEDRLIKMAERDAAIKERNRVVEERKLKEIEKKKKEEEHLREQIEKTNERLRMAQERDEQERLEREERGTKKGNGGGRARKRRKSKKETSPYPESDVEGEVERKPRKRKGSASKPRLQKKAEYDSPDEYPDDVNDELDELLKEDDAVAEKEANGGKRGRSASVSPDGDRGAKRKRALVVDESEDEDEIMPAVN